MSFILDTFMMSYMPFFSLLDIQLYPDKCFSKAREFIFKKNTMC